MNGRVHHRLHLLVRDQHRCRRLVCERRRRVLLPEVRHLVARVRQLAHPELRKRPWSLRVPSVDGDGGRFARSPCHLTRYMKHCPLFPVQ